MTMHEVVFFTLSLLTLAGAFGAVTQRNLTRALLSVVVFFLGIAALFFSLDAEMLGAVQILVYVGAVAVLMIYAIVLTRPADGGEERRGRFPLISASVAALVGGLLVAAVLRSPLNATPRHVPSTGATHELAETMLRTYALPFEIASLLLTAALVGAVVIALDEIRGVRKPGARKGGA